MVVGGSFSSPCLLLAWALAWLVALGKHVERFMGVEGLEICRAEITS